MNEQEKQIHSMVQRLAHLDKEQTKKKQEGRVKNAEKIRKREQKIQDKRDANKKEMKKAAYKKGGIKAVKGISRGKKWCCHKKEFKIHLIKKFPTES